MRAVAAIVLAMLALPVWAQAEPRIRGLAVQIKEGAIAVDFDLEGAWHERLEEQVKSGLTTVFTYRMRLYRKHSNWLDDQLAEKELMASVTYNPITDEYLVNYHIDGRLGDARVLRSWSEMLQAMGQVRGFPIFPITAQLPRRKLYVRVRAEMTSVYKLGVIPGSLATAWERSPLFKLGAAR